MPVLATTLRFADAAADRLGLLARPFAPDQLLALACRRTALTDIGDPEIMAPMRRFLEALTAEADLSLVGRYAARWDVLRFLSNLLRLQAAETASPSILDQPIEQPIFITGLPRSGTSFLHRLMLEDQANAAPRVWQVIEPYSPGGPDQSRRHVSRNLRAFERLAPEFRGLHPLAADSPQECSEIAAHVFRSLRFDSTYHIPSYRRWLDGAGHLSAYRFERRFLKHLQVGQGQPRWVLKCPDHLFALADLRAAFPDARIVFVHRDPLKVLLSVAKLTEVLRAPFTRRIDRHAIGRQESTRWHLGTERMIAAAAGTGFAAPICHVHYLDLISHPLQAVSQVYRHFGLPLTDATAARINSAVAEHPNGGYAHQAYRFEDHGLDAHAEREKFAAYMRYFDIDPESDGLPARRATGAPGARAKKPAFSASLRSADDPA